MLSVLLIHNASHIHCASGTKAEMEALDASFGNTVTPDVNPTPPPKRIRDQSPKAGKGDKAEDGKQRKRPRTGKGKKVLKTEKEKQEARNS